MATDSFGPYALRQRPKQNWRGPMSSDERARDYPERITYRCGAPFDPLVRRGSYQLGAARRIGFYAAVARASQSAREWYTRRIRESYAMRWTKVAPLP